MEIRKKVIISGSVLLLLVGATILSESLKSQGVKMASGLFYPEYNALEIESVTVGDSANGVTLTKGSEWRVTPRGTSKSFLADSVKVKTLLDKIGLMKRDQLVSENRSNQSSLGVTSETGIEVSYTDASKQETTFYIGKKGANYRYSHVREKGSDRVYLVSGSIRFAFKTEVNEWRDRTIFSHSPDSISKITVVDKVEITRVNDVVEDYWMVKQDGVEKRANPQTMNSYLRSMSSYVCNDWADNTLPESYWQGANGGASVTITMLDGSSETITVGRPDESGRKRFYVKNSAREDLYFVVGSAAQIPFMTFEYLTYFPEEKKEDTTKAETETSEK